MGISLNKFSFDFYVTCFWRRSCDLTFFNNIWETWQKQKTKRAEIKLKQTETELEIQRLRVEEQRLRNSPKKSSPYIKVDDIITEIPYRRGLEQQQSQ